MRNELLGILPPFRNKKVLITEYQSTSDIITQLLNGHDKFKNDYDKISNKFWRGNLIASCKYVFDFLKKNVKYKIEPDTHQSIKSPSAIFSTGYTGKGYNDCKHYSSVFGGLIDSWIRKKKTNNVNWCYRFANYKLFQTQPHHVFVVIKNGSDEIWCDAVLSSFNEKKPYINKIDKKPNKLYNLSGTKTKKQCCYQYTMDSFSGFEIGGVKIKSQSKQKNIKKTSIKYKIFEYYPSQTIEQWLSIYNDMLANYYATPKSDVYFIKESRNALKKISNFLKTKGIKFI